MAENNYGSNFDQRVTASFHIYTSYKHDLIFTLIETFKRATLRNYKICSVIISFYFLFALNLY